MPQAERSPQDAQRNTPLHLVLLSLLSKPNQPHLVATARELMRAGARVDLANGMGQTPVALAVQLASKVLDGGAAAAGVPAGLLYDPLVALAQGHGAAADSNVFNSLNSEVCG